MLNPSGQYSINWFKNLMLMMFLIWSCSAWSVNSDNADQILTLADEIYSSNPDSTYQLCKSLDPEELSGEQRARRSTILARYYLLMSEYEGAEIETVNAATYYQKKEDKNNLAYIYSLQSILANKLGELEDSRKLILKSYEAYKELGLDHGQINTLSNIANDYLLAEMKDSVLYYLNIQATFKNKMDQHQSYYFYQNWGRYYMMIKDFEMAQENLLQALNVSELEEMTDSKATILMMLGEMYSQQGKFEEAIKYANMSYAFSDANNLNYEKRDAVIVLVGIAEKQQDFLAAFKYQQELSQLDKEILNIEKINNVKKVKSLLAIAEKEKIIADKDAELSNAELENASQTFRNRIFMFSLIAVLVILVLVGFAFYKTKKLNEIISDQHQTLETKNHQLSEALTDIDGSLNYSKLIQDTLMPGVNSWRKLFSEDFTIFLPRDKVSGDFYWNYEDEEFVYFCVADCTGHGVPGAMVSVVGMNALDASVTGEKISSPGKILDRLSEIVERTFSNEDTAMKDGMDIAFCRLNKQTKELTFSGANNPLYVVNKKGLTILKPNKQPIGKYDGRKSFDEESIQLSEGDAIYLFSDGYADQFGGPKGKKFMYKTLRLIIEENRNNTMKEQKEILLKAFLDWKEGYEQVDDVCIVGVRV